MKPDTIRLSQSDHERLRLLLSRAAAADRGRIAPHPLWAELVRAEILPPDRIPADVVTMHSRIRVQDLDSNEVDEYVLTFPAQADAGQRRLSVLAPIGTAILGFAEGDELAWETPGGIRRIRILRVQQPRDTIEAPASGPAASPAMSGSERS